MKYEINDDRDKDLSITEYLNEIKPFLKDIIVKLQKSDTWNIHLTIPIKFTSSKDTNEKQAMNSKSDNIEIITYDNLEEIIEELLESLLSRYQIGLGTPMTGSDFIFDCVNLLHYKCHKINSKCDRSFIDSLGWIKKKK